MTRVAQDPARGATAGGDRPRVLVIDHETALKALRAGASKARELGQPSSLAIVDMGGNLLAFLRVDDAAFATVEIAQNKAYTAAALRSPTGNWLEVSQPNGALYGLERSVSRPFVVFGGGLPIFDGKRVVGGVGVSGGPVDTDVAIAGEMVAVLQEGSET